MDQEIDREKMRDTRKALGLNQTEAAKLAGLATVGRWSDIETGRTPNVTLETLNRIAIALGLDARDLLTAPKRKAKRKP